MAQKLEPITIINVDEVPYAVSDMSETVKRLVSVYNDWRDEEVEAQQKLLQVQAAMRDLSREIVLSIKQEKEADAAAAAAVQQAADAAAVNEVAGETLVEGTPQGDTP